jgi:hypothetical protein
MKNPLYRLKSDFSGPKINKNPLLVSVGRVFDFDDNHQF